MKALAFAMAMAPVTLLLIIGLVTGIGWVFLAALIASALPIAIAWKGEEP